jgi:hypothetical protein
LASISLQPFKVWRFKPGHPAIPMIFPSRAGNNLQILDILQSFLDLRPCRLYDALVAFEIGMFMGLTEVQNA